MSLIPALSSATSSARGCATLWEDRVNVQCKSVVALAGQPARMR
jgi:hypothetical protein